MDRNIEKKTPAVRKEEILFLLTDLKFTVGGSLEGGYVTAGRVSR